MTQVFREDGTVIPVTLIQAGPCTVIGVRTPEKNGYGAVQLAFGAQKATRVNKAQMGEWKDMGAFQAVREFRLEDPSVFQVGSIIDAAVFEPGEKVDVVGTSKGRGFQGVVKRHHFQGGRGSHGNKDQLRMPGSLGAKGPAKVFKDTRMGGHMGSDRVTVKNLEIVEVRDGGVLAIKGAIPGSRNGLVLIKTAKI